MKVQDERTMVNHCSIKSLDNKQKRTMQVHCSIVRSKVELILRSFLKGNKNVFAIYNTIVFGLSFIQKVIIIFNDNQIFF